MPAIVDHDQRRREIADIAVSLIARHGIGGVTIRQLAAAGRCSTAALTHYFKTKDELLLFTFSHATERHLVQIIDPADGWTPSAVRRSLEERLPLTEFELDNWRVFFAFLGTPADGSAEIACQQTRQIQRSRRLLAERLREAYRLSDTQAADMAESCQVAVIGIAMELCFGLAKGNTPQQARKMIDGILDAHFPGTTSGLDAPPIERRKRAGPSTRKTLPQPSESRM